MSKQKHIKFLTECDSGSLDEGFLGKMEMSISRYERRIRQEYERIKEDPEAQRKVAQEIADKVGFSLNENIQLTESDEVSAWWVRTMKAIFGVGIIIGAITLATVNTLLGVWIGKWLLGTWGKGMIAFLVVSFYGRRATRASKDVHALRQELDIMQNPVGVEETSRGDLPHNVGPAVTFKTPIEGEDDDEEVNESLNTEEIRDYLEVVTWWDEVNLSRGSSLEVENALSSLWNSYKSEAEVELESSEEFSDIRKKIDALRLAGARRDVEDVRDEALRKTIAMDRYKRRVTSFLERVQIQFEIDLVTIAGKMSDASSPEKQHTTMIHNAQRAYRKKYDQSISIRQVEAAWQEALSQEEEKLSVDSKNLSLPRSLRNLFYADVTKDFQRRIGIRSSEPKKGTRRERMSSNDPVFKALLRSLTAKHDEFLITLL